MPIIWFIIGMQIYQGQPAGKRNAFGILLIGVHHSVQSGHLEFWVCLTVLLWVGHTVFSCSPPFLGQQWWGKRSRWRGCCMQWYPWSSHCDYPPGTELSSVTEDYWQKMEINPHRRNWEQSASRHALQSRCWASAPWRQFVVQGNKVLLFTMSVPSELSGAHWSVISRMGEEDCPAVLQSFQH